MIRTTSLPRAARRSAGTAGPRRAAAVAGVTLAAALALAGCADASSPSSDATTATSASPSASAEPSPTPEPTTPGAEATTASADEGETGTGTNTISAPVNGSTVAGPQVEVTGEGTAFEGTLTWRVVTTGAGDLVAEGFTTGGANGTVGPFAFTVELAAGGYTLELWEPGQSDGGSEGGTARTGLVTTSFTVS